MPLTRGYFAIIDAADAEFVGRHSWYTHDSPRCCVIYAACKASGRIQLLHRALWAQWGMPTAPHLDHINGNGLDNRRANLRAASAADNQHNRGKQRNNTSGFKGVYWRPKNRNWVAMIGVRGRFKYLGSFRTREEAGAAYAKAARELHGEFARPV